MKLTTNQVFDFQKKIYDYYHKNKRDFSWRSDITEYKIFISEVMLQQTQTSRVIFKFEQWIEKFPDFISVAQASQYEILSTWQGLGYNRRGLNLARAAQMIIQEFNGLLPKKLDDLQKIPGIGPNTAGSISAFAFNLPVVFIETNIRTVFLYEFFQDQQTVHDKEILFLVQETLDQKNPRDWYYALMDYGVYLKKELKINNKKSKHYTRQSKFIGSRRQVRGAIIRILSKTKKLSEDDLFFLIEQEVLGNQHSVESILQELLDEKLVYKKDDFFYL
jgi:A/G-specific adenine glycosylase